MAKNYKYKREFQNDGQCGNNTSTKFVQGIPDVDFSPPAPPPGNPDLWELQFCKWWGWSWIQKHPMVPLHSGAPSPGSLEIHTSTEHRRSHRKKKKPCWKCWQTKKDEDEPVPSTTVRIHQEPHMNLDTVKMPVRPGYKLNDKISCECLRNNSSDTNSSESDCLSKHCAAQQPCIYYIPTQCHCQKIKKPKCSKKFDCRQTQTEQKIVSEKCVGCKSKHKRPKQSCACMSPIICCPYVLGNCPCITNTCPCNKSENSIEQYATISQQAPGKGDITNYSLTKTVPDVPISHLFNKHHNVNEKSNKPSFLNIYDQIKMNDSIYNSRYNEEHVNLLTSVCDAILSNEHSKFNTTFNNFKSRNSSLNGTTPNISSKHPRKLSTSTPKIFRKNLNSEVQTNKKTKDKNVCNQKCKTDSVTIDDSRNICNLEKLLHLVQMDDIEEIDEISPPSSMNENDTT